MSRASLITAPLVLALLALCLTQHAHAQSLSGSARLIVADQSPNNTGLWAVDLPSFNATHRISLPGLVESMGMTQNNEYIGVFRARGGNDQNVSSAKTRRRSLLPYNVCAGTHH